VRGLDPLTSIPKANARTINCTSLADLH
jgi:hypothetical protein